MSIPYIYNLEIDLIYDLFCLANRGYKCDKFSIGDPEYDNGLI